MKRFGLWLLLVSLLVSLLAPATVSADAELLRSAQVDLSAPAAPGQFLVQFAPGISAAERSRIAAQMGATIINRVAALDTEVLEFPALKANAGPRAAEQLLVRLRKNPNVLMAEPNYIYTVNWVPNDPGLSQQWAWEKINAYNYWDTNQGSSSVVIAVVDTGVQLNHPDLSSKLVPGYNFVSGNTNPEDGNGHGTHVAGTAAAITNNSTGGAGTCPNCKIMPVKVLNDSGSGTLDAVANGIIWAADNGAHVINLSLGASSGASTLENAVNYAWNKGAFLACAAGNSNTSSPSYPAYYDRCFAVAATDSADQRAWFSNYGTWVEVAAPGVDIYSTWINSSYNTISGTSMATPHVAGQAGLLASLGMSNSQIWNEIMNTAEPISGTGTLWTGGRIRLTAGGGDPTPPPSDSVIANGGFEEGTSPWVQSSTGGYELITTDRPHTGSYSAWLGGYNSGTDKISQTVTIPSGGQLSYWWYQTSQEGTSTAYDYFRVRLYDPNSGALVATVKTRSNRDARNAWYQDSIDLSGYAGQTLRIEFSVTTDFIYPTSFWVDDVALQ
ncbi:MAG: S8 family serine peptidase [Bacillota bacterium]